MKTPGFINFGAPTSCHPVFLKALDQIIGWKKGNEFPEFIIPLRPDHFDRRIAYQQSCFTFHVPKKSILTTGENPTLQSFIIPAAAKGAIRYSFLFSVLMSSAYTEIWKASRSVLRPH